MKKLKEFILPVILLFLFGLFQVFGWLERVDHFIYDTLLCSEREPSEEIVIVGIDEHSINEIGTWPWPRLYVADAVEKLVSMGAAAVGVNIVYDSYDTDDRESDEKLVETARNTDRLVLAATGMVSSGSAAGQEFEDYVGPFEELAEVTATGFINVNPDSGDGVLRNAFTAFSYGDITVRSLPYEVYRTWCRTMGVEEHEIPLDAFGEFPIHYAAGPGDYTALSLWTLINDQYDPELIRDKIVLIGPYAQGLNDDWPTPLSRGSSTYGVEILANIIQNMIEGDIKRESPVWMDLVALALLGMLSIGLLRLFKPLSAAGVMVLLMTVWLGVVWLFYGQLGLILAGGGGVLFPPACYVARLGTGLYRTQHEKQYIQGLFGRFVAPEVVKEIISGDVKIELGGVEREITLLFVDIRGFTAFSESNPPGKVVDMVNRYLSLTSRAIQENGGTIDKFIGDATMAVFNAPNDLPDHALRAVRTAWAMKQGAISLQEEIQKDYGVDLQFGIGINTGIAVVGNMGSDFRMEYTAIGDTVNTAARLEANALKGQILLSEATYMHVKDHVDVIDLGVLNVKNKKVGIRIYSLDHLRD